MGLGNLLGGRDEQKQNRCTRGRHVFVHEDDTKDWTHINGEAQKIVTCKHCNERARLNQE